MDLDEIKRGLRAEIKKRENEQYFTFQTNIRQMCKDVLAKLEELESENESLLQQNRHQKYKRCFKMARWCTSMMIFNSKYGTDKKWHFFKKWHKRCLKLAEKFKEAK